LEKDQGFERIALGLESEKPRGECLTVAWEEQWRRGLVRKF
jgi:hypothetical protein